MCVSVFYVCSNGADYFRSLYVSFKPLSGVQKWMNRDREPDRLYRMKMWKKHMMSTRSIIQLPFIRLYACIWMLSNAECDTLYFERIIQICKFIYEAVGNVSCPIQKFNTAIAISLWSCKRCYLLFTLANPLKMWWANLLQWKIKQNVERLWYWQYNNSSNRIEVH